MWCAGLAWAGEVWAWNRSEPISSRSLDRFVELPGEENWMACEFAQRKHAYHSFWCDCVWTNEPNFRISDTHTHSVDGWMDRLFHGCFSIVSPFHRRLLISKLSTRLNSTISARSRSLDASAFRFTSWSERFLWPRILRESKLFQIKTTSSAQLRSLY